MLPHSTAPLPAGSRDTGAPTASKEPSPERFISPCRAGTGAPQQVCLCWHLRFQVPAHYVIPLGLSFCIGKMGAWGRLAESAPDKDELSPPPSATVWGHGAEACALCMTQEQGTCLLSHTVSNSVFSSRAAYSPATGKLGNPCLKNSAKVKDKIKVSTGENAAIQGTPRREVVFNPREKKTKRDSAVSTHRSLQRMMQILQSPGPAAWWLLSHEGHRSANGGQACNPAPHIGKVNLTLVTSTQPRSKLRRSNSASRRGGRPGFPGQTRVSSLLWQTTPCLPMWDAIRVRVQVPGTWTVCPDPPPAPGASGSWSGPWSPHLRPG